jgi:hypothetical protein
MDRVPTHVIGPVLEMLDLRSLAELGSSCRSFHNTVAAGFAKATVIPTNLFVHAYFQCLRPLWWRTGADDAPVSAQDAAAQQAWLCMQEDLPGYCAQHTAAGAHTRNRSHTLRQRRARAMVDASLRATCAMMAWLFRLFPAALAFLPGARMPDGWPLPFDTLWALARTCPQLRYLDLSGARLIHDGASYKAPAALALTPAPFVPVPTSGDVASAGSITATFAAGDAAAAAAVAAAAVAAAAPASATPSSSTPSTASSFKFCAHEGELGDSWLSAFVAVMARLRSLQLLDVTFCVGMGTPKVLLALTSMRGSGHKGLQVRA